MSVNKTYNNFLFDSSLYQKLKDEWKKLFFSLFPHEKFDEWVTNIDGNGKEIHDGNPIYTAFFKGQGKAIRVIQINHHDDGPSLTVWEDKVEIEDTEVTELVLFVKTDKLAFSESEKLIKKFIDGDLLSSTIELVNIQFEEIYERRKSKPHIVWLDQGSLASETIIKPLTDIHITSEPFSWAPKSIHGPAKPNKNSYSPLLSQCNYYQAKTYFNQTLKYLDLHKVNMNLYMVDPVKPPQPLNLPICSMLLFMTTYDEDSVNSYFLEVSKQLKEEFEKKKP